MKSSNLIPSSVAIPTDKDEMKDLKKGITAYLKTACFTATEIKTLFQQMDNLEWDAKSLEKFIKSNVPGKKFADIQGRLINSMILYCQLTKKATRKSFMGY